MVINLLLPAIGIGWGLWILPKDNKIKFIQIGFFAILLIGSAFTLQLSMAHVIFFSVFLTNVITDTHEGLVYDYSLYALAPISLYLFYGERSYIAGIFMILIPIYRKSKKLQYYFGEGDLWILLFTSMAYGRDVFFTLFYASCLGMIESFVLKKKEVYFVPFLFIGLLLAQYEALNALLV